VLAFDCSDGLVETRRPRWEIFGDPEWHIRLSASRQNASMELHTHLDMDQNLPNASLHVRSSSYLFSRPEFNS
jgi:hypothetical protein